MPQLDQNLTEYSSCFEYLMYLNGAASNPIVRNASDDNNDKGVYYTEDMCFEEISFYETVVRNSQYWLKGVLLVVLGSLGLIGNLITILVLWRIDSNR